MRLTRALLLLTLLARASAQNDVNASLDEPPYGPDGLVNVFVTMSFIKVHSIDAVSATYYADFYVQFAWRDDRVAGLAGYWPDGLFTVDAELINAAAGNSQIALDDTDYTTRDAPPLWLDSTLSNEAKNGAWVEVAHRMALPLDAAFDLREFPFDKQSVQVIVESKSYDSDSLVLAFTRDIAEKAVPRTLAIDGWTIVSVVPKVSLHTYDASADTYSRLVLNINVSRRAPSPNDSLAVAQTNRRRRRAHPCRRGETLPTLLANTC